MGSINLGCKPSNPGAVVTAPHTQTKSASRAGWVDVSISGFTISLPADMKVKDLSQKDVNAMMDRAKQRRPNDQKIQDALRKDVANGGLKLVATLKNASATGFHNSIAVLVEVNRQSKTLEELFKSNMRAIETISEPGSVVGGQISLPCGPAARVQSSRQRQDGSTTALTSYLMLRGSRVYVFSFASKKNDQDDWRATAQSAMESLKFTP